MIILSTGSPEDKEEGGAQLSATLQKPEEASALERKWATHFPPAVRMRWWKLSQLKVSCGQGDRWLVVTICST